MITKLTNEQIKKFSEYVDEWLKIGLSTETNVTEAERAIDEVYKCGGLEPPKVKIWLRNPLEGCIGSYMLTKLDVSQVWDQVWDQVGSQVKDQVWGQVENQVWDQVWGQVGGQVGSQVWDQVWGQVGSQVWDQVGGRVGNQVKNELYKAGYGCHAANWLAFYSYFQMECGVECNKLSGLMEYSKYGGWFWPFRGAVILTPKPSEIHLKNKRLYREGGPAIRYEGFSIWTLNGVQVEQWMAETPTAELDTKRVLSIKNVEQRAEVIKRMGVKQLFNQLPNRLLDTKDGYELYSINFSNGIYPERIYLKMQNPSVDEIHLEAVHPDCRTVEQALSWRNFGAISVPHVAPLQLT